MTENIYAIIDSAAGIVLKPLIIQRNDVQPLREFGELVKNNETMIGRHPEDFTLAQIGSINLQTGEVTDTAPKRIVAIGTDLLPKPELA